MRHTLSVIVINHPGVLSRVSGLFSRRGYNIESLVVSTTEDESISRMTIIVEGDDQILEQVMKQLNKLIDVIKVLDITGQNLSRELALFRIKCKKSEREDILKIIKVYKAKIIDLEPKTVTVELTGASEKIDAFEIMMKESGIIALARTGALALEKS